ncbi:MAG: tetratricopeptide repeat protein [Candidatus Obscuribacterales bacterium]|nr:tetratricopeptide repeat protein [Candidatus Obscuribacterales bacterium]
MHLPPDEVPSGLTAAEYRKLHTLYTLMGKHEEALEAINLATKLAPQAAAVIDSSELTNEEQYNLGLQIGQKIVAQILLLASKGQNGEAGDAEKDIDEFLREMKPDFNAAGLRSEQILEVEKNLRAALQQASTSHELPPRDVPEGLSAKEYYELGIHYKEIGWTEQSRDALGLAFESDETGIWGTKARTYLRSKLPHHPIPLAAEQLNIQGFNAMMSGDMDHAFAIFSELTKVYPDFEWPYGNLGSMHIRDGNIKEAQKLLNKALSINPHYINAWYHLCRSYLLDKNIAQAQACLDEIAKIDADDENLQGMQITLKNVAEWDD